MARPARIKTRGERGAAVAFGIHPLAELFPPLDAAALADLTRDIAAHGMREKIVFMLEGGNRYAIIDGRNRFQALLDLGLIENPVAVADLPKYFRAKLPAEGGALAFVLSRNLHRRHLSESQRAMVAARLAVMGPGRPKNPANLRNIPAPDTDVPVLSQEAAAKALNVSERSVSTARAVTEGGAADLVEAVRRGEVSLHVAEVIAERPQEVQSAIVAQGRDEIMAAAKRFRAEDQAAKKARRAEREAGLAARIAEGNAALGASGKRYGVIYADPEWRFEVYSRETGMDRAADNHYPTSPTAAIAARPVGEIAARDCVLFLWATAPMLPDALAVMAAWGFAYKSHIVWKKDRLGTGYWFRNAHELLLVGVRGDVPAPAMGEQWPSVIEAPVGAHSAKPAEFHALIEQYYPGLPKIELNARVAREGWDRWGAEAPEEAGDE